MIGFDMKLSPTEPMIELMIDRSRSRRQGPTVRVRVHPGATVRELQSSIANKIGIEANQQHLEFNDRVLTDQANERLSSFGISDRSLIWLDDRGSICQPFH